MPNTKSDYVDDSAQLALAVEIIDDVILLLNGRAQHMKYSQKKLMNLCQIFKRSEPRKNKRPKERDIK